MIDRTFIEKIEEMANPCIVSDLNFYGLHYSDKQLHLISPPTAKTLIVETLTGFVDFIDALRSSDDFHPDSLLIHIDNYITVDLLSKNLGPYKIREKLITAKWDYPQFQFDQYKSIEKLIIELQSKFAQTAATAELMSFLSKVRDLSETTLTDDGVSQAVSLQHTVSSVKDDVAPNPVMLAPYRTFAEIDQPESQFILRLQKIKDGDIAAALFESDGWNWKLEASQNIFDYLKEKVADIAIIR